MMETKVLGYQLPLYGRRTGQWKEEHLKFFEFVDFFQDYSAEEIVKVYDLEDFEALMKR